MFEAIRNQLKFHRIPSWLHNISKVYLGDMFSKIFAVGSLILLIRGLTVSDYALYTVFYAVSAFTPNLIGSGINRAMVRFSAERLSLTGEKPLELYVTSFVFQIVLYIALCAVILLISGDMLNTLLFGKKVFSCSLSYGLIAGFGFLATQAGRSIYQAEERFGMYIKTLWLRQILIFFAILVLFWFRLLDFQHTAKSVLIVELLIGTIVCWHIFRHFSMNMVISIFRDRLDVVKEFLSAAKWLIAYTVVMVVFDRLNIFMLSHLSTESELANFGVAHRYFGFGLLLLGSIHTVLLPLFSKVEMQNVSDQRSFAVKWLKNTYWLIIPIIAIGLILKPVFIWINGEQYSRAFYILLVLLPGVWIGLMFSPLINIIIARKELKLLFVLGGVALLFSVIGNYYLIPVWGGLGAAVILVLSHALVNLTCGLRVIFLKR